MSIYFYYGDEEYLIEKEINKLRKNLNSDFSDMNFKKYNNPEFGDFIAILRTIPMMFGNMVIVINCLDYLTKSFDESQIEEIKSALDSNTKGVDIVLTAVYSKNENKRNDSKCMIFKLFSSYSSKEFLSIKTYKIAELATVIKQMAKEKNIILTNDATNALIEQIGNNLREFDVELDKLAITAYPKTEISYDDVREVCITNEDLFNLTEFILRGETGKAVIEFRKLTDKKFPMEILATLQTMLRKWILIKLKSKTMSFAEISKLTGLHEFVVKQTHGKLKNIPVKNLIRLKQNLINAEYKIKSANSLNLEEEIENAVLR